MFIGRAVRPLTDIEDLREQRDRLRDLMNSGLVSRTVQGHLCEALRQIEQRIDLMLGQQQLQQRAAA